MAETKDFTRVRARHILVDSKENAEKMRQEIKSGESTFEEMAKGASKCPSGANGGDLGYFERGMMVPEFEKPAFDPSVAVGEVTEPIQTQFGWHLLVVEDRQ